MVRTPNCDKSGVKKGTWTPEEDRKLIAYVTRYGCWNWRQLPKFAGLSRCGKSCRLRWLNYLRPNLKKGNYTKEEEETIIRLHASMGNRWSAIAATLPGRTDNDVKNHWHTYLKKVVKQNHNSRDGHLSKHELVQEKWKKQKENHNDNKNGSNPLQILESSSVSLEHQPSILSSELSSLSADTITSSSNDIFTISENDFSNLLESYEATSENFWTNPFVFDNIYYMENEFIRENDCLFNGDIFNYEA